MNDLNRWKHHIEQQWAHLPRPHNDSNLLVLAGATVLATALTVALTWNWRKKAAQRLHNVEPVYDFDTSRFAGSWQEYAHITPRNQEPVTDAAMYLRELDNGAMQLSRRRYCPVHKQWHTEERTLTPVRTPDIGAFESDEGKSRQLGVVILDPHYRWAMVVGETVDDLWLLVRPDTKLPTRIFNQMMAHAELLGFDTRRVHVLHR